MAGFVVYDLSNLDQTLLTATKWKKMIKNTVCKENGDPIPVYLLGNKVSTTMHDSVTMDDVNVIV